jgi:predicted dehydrogenase
VDCVAEDKPVAPYGATFEDGYRCQVIMDANLRSSRTGRRIELRY